MLRMGCQNKKNKETSQEVFEIDQTKDGSSFDQADNHKDGRKQTHVCILRGGKRQMLWIYFLGRERNKISKDASKFLFEIYLNGDFSKFQNPFRFVEKLQLLAQLLVSPSPSFPYY